MAKYSQLMNKENLKKKSVKELENILESLVTKNDSDFTSVIEALISKNNEKDSKRFKELETELLISNIRKNNTTNDRFTALKRSEIRAFFSDEKVNYIKVRIDQTSNPLLRAKYADIIYELNKKEINFAKEAINAYLKSSKIYIQRKFSFKFIDAMERALSIGLFIKDISLIKASYEAHINSIPILNNDKDYYGLMGVIESLIERVKKLKSFNIDFDSFEKTIEEIIIREQEPSQSTYNLHRKLLSLLLSFPLIKKDDNKSKLIRTRIADAFESEAIHVGKTRSQMIAAKFYEDALKIHISIGSDKLITENLKKKIRIANKKAIEKEFKKIPLEFSLPIEAIDRYLSMYKNKNEKEIYDLLSIDDQLLPNYHHIVKTLVQSSHPIMPFHQSAMRGSIKVKNVTTTEDKIEHDSIMQMMLYTEAISRAVLDKIFELIQKEYPAYSKGLIEKISSSNLVNDERKSLLTHGIERYAKKDYVSSMHILVFQIEGILKDTLYTIDGATFSYRNNEMRELTLGTIIRELTKRKIFNINLLKFIEINLCEIRAKNIRNDIAHGNLNMSLFTRYNNQILLLILLKLTAYKIKKKK